MFTFNTDSFNISTEDFKKKGRLVVVDGPTPQLVLVWSQSYLDHGVIIVESHSPGKLSLRYKNSLGSWVLYELEKARE